MKLIDPKLLVATLSASLFIMGSVAAVNQFDGRKATEPSLRSSSEFSQMLNPGAVKTANPQEAGINQMQAPTNEPSTNSTSVTASPNCDISQTPANNEPEEDMVDDTNDTTVNVSCESSSESGSQNNVNINSSSQQSVTSDSGNASSSNRTTIDVDIN